MNTYIETCDQKNHYENKTITSLPKRLLSMAVRLSDVLGQWHQRSRQRRALMALDDHLLNDIGLSRADAYNEFQKPFWQK